MPPSTIHEIRIKGYKSLADETKLEIRPLTILAGANSSGKSSLMQPLLLLKQTLASPSEPSVIELAGPNVQFTNYEQMFHRRPGKEKSANMLKIGFSAGAANNPDQLDLTYSLTKGVMRLEKQKVVIKQGNQNSFSLSLKPGILSEGETASLPPKILEFWKSFVQKNKLDLSFKAVASRGFLDLVIGAGNIELSSGPISSDINHSIRQLLLELIHIPGLRGNPARVYPLRKVNGPRFDGHFQDYVAGIVASWKGEERLSWLSDALRDLGLTWKVEARSLDATRVEIVVGRLRNARQGGGKDMVNIADVGFGVSQILPVLVALETAMPGQLVYLEQPEIHLHPKAQKNLAKLFGEAAKKQKRLVVETHSSILIRGIQTLVAKGELDPKLVKLHWFTRDDETGTTKVTSADLDDNGAFGADWPEDFDDTYLESEAEYLNAVEARYLA